MQKTRTGTLAVVPAIPDGSVGEGPELKVLKACVLKKLELRPEVKRNTLTSCMEDCWILQDGDSVGAP